MSLAEIKNFIRSASKKHAMQQIQFLSLTAVGSQGDSKNIKKILTDIEKSIYENES